MKISNIGNNLSTPKNYSRKGKICLCPVFLYKENIVHLERVTVKYEVEPNKETHSKYIKKLKKSMGNL